MSDKCHKKYAIIPAIMPTDFSMEQRYNPRKLKKESNKMYNSMNYEEFMEAVRERIERWVGCDKEVMIQPVIKNNGIVMDGLIIQEPELNISPYKKC